MNVPMLTLRPARPARPAVVAPRAANGAPPPWEIVALAAIAALSLLGGGVGLYTLVNLGAPLALIGVEGLACWRSVRLLPETIWTPLFAFRVGVIAFFGIGGLVPFVADAALVDYIMIVYSYTEAESAKLNLLFAVYTLLVITFAGISSTVWPRLASSSSRPIGMQWSAVGLGLLFFIAGYGVIVGTFVATALGIISFIVPSTLLLPFEAASAVGVFLIAHHALEKKGIWFAVIGGVLIANLVAGLILYNKSLIILPILFVSLAVLMHRITALRIAAIAASLLIALTVLQPAIGQARELHASRYGEFTTGGSVGERLDYALSFWTDGPLREASASEGIARLTHVPIGSYLVSSFDYGSGGDTIMNGLLVLVPRILWPDKPIVSSHGRDLNYELTGSENSALSPTTAGDIYWNFGWPGVLLVAPLLGICLWLLSSLALQILIHRDWFMMPFVLLAFRIGLAVDIGFIMGVVAPLVASVIAYGALRFTKTLLDA